MEKNKSKFYFKDNRSFKQKATDFGQSMLFWKGRRKGIIHTRTIVWEDLKAVFFPKNFHEKYSYLGAVPWDEGEEIFKALEPLVVFMDYKARPTWCPRWLLRFLHLFGSDNSIVRVRNRRLHNLEKRLTGGIMLVDYKTKWESYDLRISVYGDQQISDLADDIETCYYQRGERQSIKEEILRLNPKRDTGYWGTTAELRDELDKLED